MILPGSVFLLSERHDGALFSTVGEIFFEDFFKGLIKFVDTDGLGEGWGRDHGF
jgi:hypothetical protein